MAHWADSRTKAHGDLKKALKVVDDTLSFTKDSVGKPSRKERALFAAAIAFAYGVWENYVEQLAIELTQTMAERLDPKKVPDRVRRLLEKSTAWELAVAPGWRQLWVKKVEAKAVGDDEEKFGLNTAKAGQVQDLLELAGVEGALANISAGGVPEHLRESVSSVADAVNQLVALRGQIVHTGSVPGSLRKGHVREWRDFVENLASALDSVCRKRCKELDE
jgi:hypothetical protein